MTNENDLLVNTGRYLYGAQSLADLVHWVQAREEFWTSLPSDSEYRHLAGTIMLAAYEVDDEVRDESEAREIIREAAGLLPPDSIADIEVDLTQSSKPGRIEPDSEGTTTAAASLTAAGSPES